MGLAQVKEEIVAQAKDRAAEVVKGAEEEAKTIEHKADDEIGVYEQQARQRAEQLHNSIERKLLAAARFDAQRLIMNVKKAAINDVMESVKLKFSELGKQERERFLQNLLRQAKKEIDVETVFVNTKDKAFMKAHVEHIKDEDISGGLIAQNKDGTVAGSRRADTPVS